MSISVEALTCGCDTIHSVLFASINATGSVWDGGWSIISNCDEQISLLAHAREVLWVKTNKQTLIMLNHENSEIVGYCGIPGLSCLGHWIS